MNENNPRFMPYQPAADPADLAAEFALLQAKLPGMWREVGHADPVAHRKKRIRSSSCLRLPSDMDIPTVKQQGYEERLLFLLFLSGQTNLRMIYTTSQPVLAGDH